MKIKLTTISMLNSLHESQVLMMRRLHCSNCFVKRKVFFHENCKCSRKKNQFFYQKILFGPLPFGELILFFKEFTITSSKVSECYKNILLIVSFKFGKNKSKDQEHDEHSCLFNLTKLLGNNACISNSDLHSISLICTK